MKNPKKEIRNPKMSTNARLALIVANIQLSTFNFQLSTSEGGNR